MNGGIKIKLVRLRVRNDSSNSFESEEKKEQDQRERHEKLTIIIRFNEKAQGHMRRINLFMLTTAAVREAGEIVYAKVLNYANLLIKTANASE